MAGLLARTSAVARAHLWGPPAPGLHPIVVARLREAASAVGSAREASGWLGDDGCLQRDGGVILGGHGLTAVAFIGGKTTS
jgi:hypothetical protein